MKPILLPLFLLAITFLAACSPEQEPELAPTATIVAISQATDIATVTPLLPTVTTAATNTPTPLPTATAIPVPTATPPPFTQGRIVFLWDQREGPGLDGPGGRPPTIGLYQAIPGASPDEWTIQPLLTELVVNQVYLSPDKTKLALMILEDSDGDGQYTTWDDYKIHIYHFADGSVIRLDNQESIASRHSLSWLPDSQAVIYPQSSNIALARLDGSPPELLTDNLPDPIEGEPYSYFLELVGSPDGRLVALDAWSGTGLAENRFMPISRTITLFDTQQEAVTSVIENSAIGAIGMHWSPDSQWLAFTGDQYQGLYVLNADTEEIQQLVDLSNSTTPVWSPNSQQLAFTVNATLYVWDAATQTVKEITRKDTLSEPAWSPDGSLLAAGYSSGRDGGLLFLDSTNYTERLLPLDMVTSQVIWSPDGEWLTGIFGGEDRVGLYVVNRADGEVHFLLDTEGLNPPGSIMWLP